MRTLWIVCPVYRDVRAFLALRLNASHYLQQLPFPASSSTRFLVVDDSAGQDPDIPQLEGLPDVQVLATPFNLGHQGAIVFGLRALRRRISADDWVVTMDADGEDQPSDLPRLLEPLTARSAESPTVVLAFRTKRHETWRFRLLYTAFKVFFRLLTGTVVRTGNYAAFGGGFVRQMLNHPHFDLSYSATLLTLKTPKVLVPCERARRYAGESRMGFAALLRHGLGMMMPFTDIIATRALVAFAALTACGTVAVGAVMALHALASWTIPAWAWYGLASILAVSMMAVGNAVVLFVLFVQSQGVALRVLRRYRPSIRGFSTVARLGDHVVVK